MAFLFVPLTYFVKHTRINGESQIRGADKVSRLETIRMLSGAREVNEDLKTPSLGAEIDPWPTVSKSMKREKMVRSDFIIALLDSAGHG